MTKFQSMLIKGRHIVVTCTFMLMLIFIIPLTVKADADDTMEGAINYRFETNQNGTLATNEENDFYKLTLPSSGRIVIRGTAYIEAFHLRIYNSYGQEVWSDYKYTNQTTKHYVLNEILDFNSGIYYLCFEKHAGITGTYNFDISFSSAGESFAEPQLGRDNSFDTANAISLNKTYKGQISYYADDADFYRFTFPSPGRIVIRGTAYIEAFHLRIYNSNGQEIWSDYKYMNRTTKRNDFNNTFEFNAGTYYLCFERHSDMTGAYNFNIARSVNINFNANGGKKVSRKVVGSGTAVGTLPKTTRKGHSFVGWYTAKNGGTKISAGTTVSKNTTFYARWKKKSYTVKFNVNKGKKLSASDVKKKVTYKNKYGNLPTPKRSGYKFAGWYTKKTGGARIKAKSNVTITKNVTLYARWKRR